MLPPNTLSLSVKIIHGVRCRVFIAAIFIFISAEVRAEKGISTGTGNWSNNTTWLIGGINKVPTCGDTITILPGHTVTVDMQENYMGACSVAPAAMDIIVDSGAVFAFQTGKKMELPCGSTVQLLAYSLLDPGSGSGMSNYIYICDTLEWDAADGPISGPRTYSAGSPLPVLWLNVNIVADGKNADVLWSTASEINNHYFTVEKTTDGVNFTTIGTVVGAGTSTIVHNYQLVDPSPFTGISYYRVKQTDYDGNNSYSSLEAFNFNNSGTSKLKSFPNPVSDRIYMTLGQSDNNITYIIHIFDMKGSETIIPAEAVSCKNNLLSVDVSNLVSGIYAVQVISQHDMNWVKMMKE